MKCPNCNQAIEIGDSNFCTHCGVDMMLFTKTTETSDILYNKGLSKAKSRDLTGAAEYMTKSIEFNKNNYMARNVLGLIYFEMGRLGDALKQWVISAGIFRDSNPAREYIEITQKNSRVLEKLNDSVKIFNQALIYINQKSDDLAIIQLKKAIEINPKLIDAHNLLALCYLIQKDKSKALQSIEKVLSIDINNDIALNYYNEIFPSKQRPLVVQNTKKATQPNNAPSVSMQSSYARLSGNDNRSFKNSFHITEIISFLAGALFAFAVLYILVVPSISDSLNEEISGLKSASSTSEQGYKDRIKTLEEDEERLLNENRDLRNNIAELTGQLDLSDKIQKVNNAAELNNQGNLTEAVAILYNMDSEGLPSDVAERYESLKSSIYPKHAKNLYDNGVREFNAQRYDTARDLFTECLLYAAENANFVDVAYYNLGYIAEQNSDVVSAKKYYETILNDYPNSSQQAKARTRLQGLQ